ncbi:hypothetical protein K8R03_01725 [Candidatus Kaiserbacteria bacterium]|nr:hypothetical protein [Candidatus Kaiserbacteria bacterium]
MAHVVAFLIDACTLYVWTAAGAFFCIWACERVRVVILGTLAFIVVNTAWLVVLGELRFSVFWKAYVYWLFPEWLLVLVVFGTFGYLMREATGPLLARTEIEHDPQSDFRPPIF